MQPVALSGGLSRGLCLINKALVSARAGGKRSAQPRMLCLQGSPDATQQYIAVMNSIFAAQVVDGAPHLHRPVKRPHGVCRMPYGHAGHLWPGCMNNSASQWVLHASTAITKQKVLSVSSMAMMHGQVCCVPISASCLR